MIPRRLLASWSALRPSAAALALTMLLAACSGGSPAALTASGKDYLAKKQPRAAVLQFKNALRGDPNLHEARLLLGKALMQVGDPVTAAQEFGKLLEAKYDSTLVLPELARALLFSGEFRKLTVLYGAIDLPNPDAAADLKTSVASAWSELGDRLRSDTALRAALKARPDFGPALIHKARLLADTREHDAALALVDQVLAREPQRHDAWQLKGELLLYFRNDEAGALENFRKALAIDNTYLPAHTLIIGIHFKHRDIAAMAAQVAAVKAVLPRHPQTYFLDASLAFMQGDSQRARELVQALLRSGHENPGWLQLAGAIEFHSGSLVLAESYFTKALNQRPSLAGARRLLGTTYVRQGQSSKALATLEPLLDPKVSDPEALGVAGDAYLQIPDPANAEAMYSRAAALKPDDANYRTALALSHLAAGKVEEAFGELQATAERDAGTVADMALISARLKRGELDAALQAVNALGRKQRDSALVLTTRGRIELARGNVERARADLEKALSVDARYFPAASALAAIEVAADRPEAARQRFEKMLKLDPRLYEASLALAELRERAGVPRQDLAELLQTAIESSPTEPRLRVALVEMHLRGRNFKLALSAAQQGNAALPSNMEVLDALGRAQLASGDLQQAVSSFRRLSGINARSTLPYLRLADAYLALKDRVSAANSLKRALELQPDLFVAQRRLVEMALDANKPREALDVARDIQKQSPGNPAGYAFEAIVQTRLKDPKAAAAVLRAGLKLTDSTDLARRLHGQMYTSGEKAEAAQFAANWERTHPGDVDFDYHLGEIAIAENDVAQAETRLRRVLQKQPQNASALNNLATVLLTRGAKGALPLAEQANRLAPNRPAFMDTLAQALAAENQAQRGMEIQKQAVERAPEIQAYRLTLAKIAIQVGDKTLAKAELEKLARTGRRFEGQAEVTRLLQTL